MKNLAKMMQQAQKMQEKMGEMQEKLAAMEIAGESGAGMVKVVLNGKGEMRKVDLDPTVIDPGDKEMLEDLIVAAYADAKSKVETQMQEQMSELTGGMALPDGFKLPF